MHRVLRAAGVNSTLDEPEGKSHWWWDTLSPNDGGVLGDSVMRDFYRRCRDDVGAVDAAEATEAAAAAEAEVGRQRGREGREMQEGSGGASAQAQAQAQAQAAPAAHRCLFQNVTLTVINPASSDTTGNAGPGGGGSLCGLTVLQQHRSLERSQVQVTCRRGRGAVQRERWLLRREISRRQVAAADGDAAAGGRGEGRRDPRAPRAPPPPPLPRAPAAAAHPVLDSPWDPTHDRCVLSSPYIAPI